MTSTSPRAPKKKLGRKPVPVARRKRIISISLDPRIDGWLRLVSHRTGKSYSKFIEDALTLYLPRANGNRGEQLEAEIAERRLNFEEIASNAVDQLLSGDEGQTKELERKADRAQLLMAAKGSPLTGVDADACTNGGCLQFLEKICNQMNALDDALRSHIILEAELALNGNPKTKRKVK